MKGYIVNIDQETKSNKDYRRVLHTSDHSQLVVMSIEPGHEVGEETQHLDQFIRLEEGSGIVVLGEVIYAITTDAALLIPSGLHHNIINNGNTPLKFYSLTSPPEHKDQLVHATREDEDDEYDDGETSEPYS
jgi:mannose-6-phosphate isomerase-like protein (cupin superfamily)